MYFRKRNQMWQIFHSGVPQQACRGTLQLITISVSKVSIRRPQPLICNLKTKISTWKDAFSFCAILITPFIGPTCKLPKTLNLISKSSASISKFSDLRVPRVSLIWQNQALLQLSMSIFRILEGFQFLTVQCCSELDGSCRFQIHKQDSINKSSFILPPNSSPPPLAMKWIMQIFSQIQLLVGFSIYIREFSDIQQIFILQCVLVHVDGKKRKLLRYTLRCRKCGSRYMYDMYFNGKQKRYYFYVDQWDYVRVTQTTFWTRHLCRQLIESMYVVRHVDHIFKVSTNLNNIF